MGIDTWYAFGSAIDERTVLDLARAAIDRGLQAAGYRYVWLDAGWWNGARDAAGSIVVDNARWPHGMGWLAAWLHAHGYRAGIYTETGLAACRNGGSLGHVQQDINAFAAWGFDAVKIDYCGDYKLLRDPRHVYGQFAEAIRNDRPRRPMLLNIANADTWSRYRYTAFDSWEYAPAIATSWRTDSDLSWPGGVTWGHLLRNIDADARHPEAAGPGHFNDPDYLVPQYLSATEARTQLTMWAMLAAPLMLSVPVQTLPEAPLAMFTNGGVIAIDQDPLVAQARPVKRIGNLQAWRRPLVGGAVALAVLNRGMGKHTLVVRDSTIGLTGPLMVQDVWRNRSYRTNRLRVTIGAQAAALLRIRTAS